LREGHNTNFIGIEAMRAQKRVVAWQTFSVSYRGNCNRAHKRIEMVIARLKISEPNRVDVTGA